MTTLPASTRLPLRPPPYEPEIEQTVGNPAFTGLSPGNLRRALAHHPKLAVAFQAITHAVLFGGAVSERLREIAIIRTGALMRAEYEWGMHVSIYAQRCGLDEAQVLELTCTPSWDALSEALWNADERLVLRMVDELHHHHTVADDTWAALVARWPKEQVMELIFASGVYRMAALFLNAAAVPLEEGQRRFPPGVRPAEVPAL